MSTAAPQDLTLERCEQLLRLAYRDVMAMQQHLEATDPPAPGDIPYTAANLADEVAQEFRERLYELLGMRDRHGEPYYLVGAPSPERLSHAQPGDGGHGPHGDRQEGYPTDQVQLDRRQAGLEGGVRAS